MKVAGTLVEDRQALALVRFVDVVLRRHPEARQLVSDELVPLLVELNAAARLEQARQLEERWRDDLVPTAAAAERLGVSERTVRRRCQQGTLAAQRDADGRWLVDVG